MTEWFRLSPYLVTEDPHLADAIDGFRAPASPAGGEAESWLKGAARDEAQHVATWLAWGGDEIEAFHSLTMANLELSQGQRRPLGASHPTQGAVLIAWVARAEGHEGMGGAAVHHAIGIAETAAELVGAVAIAADAYDDDVARYWIDEWGFRRSRTGRLWLPL